MEINVLMCITLGTVFVIHTRYPDIWRDHGDDTNVLCALAPALCYGLALFFTCGLQLVLNYVWRVYMTIRRHGWIRWSAYLLSMLCFFYVCVVIPFNSYLVFLRGPIKDILAKILEENIIQIKERRPTEDIVYPVQQHVPYESFAFQVHIQTGNISRYQLEDVGLECSNLIVWDNSSPPEDLISFRWRRDEQMFSWSHRYHQNITVEKFEDNNHGLVILAQKAGLEVYRVNATLQIRLLKVFDFGNYTCEGIDVRLLSLKDWIRLRFVMKLLPLLADTFLHNKMSQSELLTFIHSDPHLTYNDNNLTLIETSQLFHYFSDTLEAYTDLIQSMFTLKSKLKRLGNFQLTEFKKSTIFIRAPHGAILQFETKYFQTEHMRQDISSEVYINNKSLFNGMSSFWDCSMMLLGAWVQVKCDGSQSKCKLPPFLTHFYFVASPDKANIPQAVFCLGSQTFGHFRLEFYRTYFNTRTRRYQSIIADHPNDLIIDPMGQSVRDNLLYIQPDISVSNVEQSDFPTQREIDSMSDKADAYWWPFIIREGLWILMGLIQLAAGITLVYSLASVANFPKRWILHGLSTSRVIERHSQPDNWINRFSRATFDVYLSFTDTDVARVQNDVLPFLERLGYRVCFRERDVPPNMQEVDAVDTAVTNSRRYVVFLSPHYLSDGLRLNLEAKAIVEAANNKGDPSSALLVVKLGHCDVPGWLRFFPLHDWTASNLSRDDHLSRLYQWVKPASQRDWKQECADVIPSFLAIMAFLLGILALKTYLEWQIS